MKITAVQWDERDIECGIIVHRPGYNSRFMIGYRVQNFGNEYALISLDDGIICPYKNKLDLARHLTDECYIPFDMQLKKRVRDYLPKGL